MYNERPAKLFAKYALPQMIGLLLNSVYLIVDGVFIGNRLGRNSMAAAAVSVPVIEILIAISMAISIGSSIEISNHLGNKDKKNANNIFNLSILIIAIVSILIVVFGSLFINKLAILLGSTPDIHKEAVAYLQYIIKFSPALLFSFALSGYMRNDNKPNLAMIALIIGSCSNILLDYIFMYPLNMGISGAALATALGPIFSVIILLPHFLRKNGNLYFAKFSIKLSNIATIFTLGFPAFMTEFTIGIVTFIYNFSIIKNGFGEIGLAAYLTIGYLALIISTLYLGISQGIQPVISYFHGQKNHKKNNELVSFGIKVMASLGIISYLFVFFLSKSFIKLFTPDDIKLIQFTQEKSIIYFSGFAFAGINILIITFLQSTKKAFKALSISLLRSIIFVPIIITSLPMFLGKESIWVAVSLSEFLTMLFAITLYYKDKKSI